MPEGGPPQVGASAPGAQTVPQVGNGQTQQPKFSLNSPEEIEAFANHLLGKTRQANRGEQEAKSEVAALKTQVEFLVAQQQAATRRAIAADVQLQAKSLGFKDPGFVYDAIANRLQYGADGMPTNAQQVLETLKASHGYLLEVQGDAGQQPPAQQPAVQNPPVQPQAQPRTGVMNAPRSQTTPGITEEYARSLSAAQYAALPADERARILAFVSTLGKK